MVASMAIMNIAAITEASTSGRFGFTAGIARPSGRRPRSPTVRRAHPKRGIDRWPAALTVRLCRGTLSEVTGCADQHRVIRRSKATTVRASADRPPPDRWRSRIRPRAGLEFAFDLSDDVADDPVDLEILGRVDGRNARSAQPSASTGGMMPPTTTGTWLSPAARISARTSWVSAIWDPDRIDSPTQ